MNEISIHVGKRIRYYRKAKGLSISQLAELICKSKSSVSKYENAEVSIDMDTLYEIANVLGISIANLTDYSAREQQCNTNQLDGFFRNCNIYYIYNIYYGKTIYQSVLLFHPDNAPQSSVTCYFDVKDLNNYYDCGCLYHGYYSASYTHVNIHLSNEINPADEMSLFFNNLFYNTGITFGISSSISEHLVAPCSVKTVISKTPINSTEKLKELLALTPEEWKQLRTSSMFVTQRKGPAGI